MKGETGLLTFEWGIKFVLFKFAFPTAFIPVLPDDILTLLTFDFEVFFKALPLDFDLADKT